LALVDSDNSLGMQEKEYVKKSFTQLINLF
jgi:hypothetical protein